jgi:hypothetical protein
MPVHQFGIQSSFEGVAFVHVPGSEMKDTGRFDHGET